MTAGRAFFIVRFERARDGGCGDLIDCTQVRKVGGLASYPLRDGVATSGPPAPRVNVAIHAGSEPEAAAEARTRGDAYARAHRTTA